MASIKKIDYKGCEFNDLHKYEIELEDNGEKVIGNIFKKQQNPYFQEGDEVEYTINDKGTLKLNKPGQTPFNSSSNSGGNYSFKSNEQESERIARSVAVKAALEHSVHTKKSVSESLKLAKTLSDFILEGKIDEPTKSDPF